MWENDANKADRIDNVVTHNISVKLWIHGHRPEPTLLCCGAVIANCLIYLAFGLCIPWLTFVQIKVVYKYLQEM